MRADAGGGAENVAVASWQRHRRMPAKGALRGWVPTPVMDSLLENMRVYWSGARREDLLFLNARAGNLLRSGIVRDVR